MISSAQCKLNLIFTRKVWHLASIVLRVRVFGTRKWPTAFELANNEKFQGVNVTDIYVHSANESSPNIVSPRFRALTLLGSELSVASVGLSASPSRKPK